MAALDQQTLVTVNIERDFISLNFVEPLFIVEELNYVDGPHETRYQHFPSLEKAKSAFDDIITKKTLEKIQHELKSHLSNKAA